MLFGARNPSQKLNTYQEKMNEASKFLALENPSLLLNRSKLMQLAREKVNADGYIYKHGKSRSKQLNLDENLSSSSSSSTGRRPRTSQSERMERISFLSESINELSKQIELKEKHREQLSNIHNYGDCEKVSKEIADIRRKRFELQVESKQLEQQQQQSDWYKNKRQKRQVRKESTSDAVSDFSDTDSRSAISTSGRSRSPTPSVNVAVPPPTSLLPPTATHTASVSFDQPCVPTPMIEVSVSTTQPHPSEGDPSHF